MYIYRFFHFNFQNKKLKSNKLKLQLTDENVTNFKKHLIKVFIFVFIINTFLITKFQVRNKEKKLK